jgi:hypothetical protein
VALGLGIAGGLAILAAGRLAPGRRVGLAAAALALVAGLVGPAAYAAESAAGVYGGGDPSAGPDVVGSSPGRIAGAPMGNRPTGDGPAGRLPGTPPTGDGGTRPYGIVPGYGPPDGALPGYGPADDGRPDGDDAPGGIGTLDDALVDYLVANHEDETWLVAVQSANAAAPIQIATGVPVMAMGGFSGSDPTPTADELAALVEAGRLRYVLLGGGIGGRGGAADGVTGWVTATCSAVTIDGASSGLYDCTPGG